MFIGLLCFGGSLASNHCVAKSEGLIKSVSLNNWPCKARSTLVNLFIIQLLSVLISAVEVAILLMIHMLEYVFQIK